MSGDAPSAAANGKLHDTVPPAYLPSAHSPQTEGAHHTHTASTPSVISTHGSASSSLLAEALQEQDNTAGRNGFRQHFMSESAMDETVNFELTNLGRQVFIWVGPGGQPSKLANLALGLVPARQGPGDKGRAPQPLSTPPAGSSQREPGSDRIAPVASTILHGKGSEASVALAQKLTARTGMPVLLAWTLPPGNMLLNAWAEQRLVAILDEFLQRQP